MKIDKKEIYLEINRKHIYIFLIGILFLSILMNIYPSWFGFSSYQFVTCLNGSIEQVIINKTMYCGDNLSELGYSVVNGVFTK